MSSKRVKPLKRRDEWEKQASFELTRVLRATESQGPFPRGVSKKGRHAEVSVVGSARMRRLNREYRGKDRATDVLSFPAPPAFQKQGVLGDLVICLPVLRAQARELGHEPEHELRVLVVHGVLHLLGLDHEVGPKQARAMARAEEKLLARLQLGRVKVGRSSKRGLISRSG